MNIIIVVNGRPDDKRQFHRSVVWVETVFNNQHWLSRRTEDKSKRGTWHRVVKTFSPYPSSFHIIFNIYFGTKALTFVFLVVMAILTAYFDTEIFVKCLSSSGVTFVVHIPLSAPLQAWWRGDLPLIGISLSKVNPALCWCGKTKASIGLRTLQPKNGRHHFWFRFTFKWVISPNFFECFHLSLTNWIGEGARAKSIAANK